MTISLRLETQLSSQISKRTFISKSQFWSVVAVSHSPRNGQRQFDNIDIASSFQQRQQSVHQFQSKLSGRQDWYARHTQLPFDINCHENVFIHIWRNGQIPHLQSVCQNWIDFCYPNGWVTRCWSVCHPRDSLSRRTFSKSTEKGRSSATWKRIVFKVEEWPIPEPSIARVRV